MRKTNQIIRQRRLGLVGIIAVIALILALVAIFTPLHKGQWECAQTVCKNYFSEQEIVDKICSDTVNGVLCSVNVDGKLAIVPKEQINFTKLQFCKEEICVKEIKTRSANYTFKNDGIQ